jgi:hypothetical protein
MEYELVVAEPTVLGGRLYAIGEVIDAAHEVEAATLHPNHFRRRAKPEPTGEDC